MSLSNTLSTKPNKLISDFYNSVQDTDDSTNALDDLCRETFDTDGAYFEFPYDPDGQCGFSAGGATSRVYLVDPNDAPELVSQIEDMAGIVVNDGQFLAFVDKSEDGAFYSISPEIILDSVTIFNNAEFDAFTAYVAEHLR